MSESAKSKDGKIVAICNYRWVDPDGHAEICRHAASCPVCGQCSRLDGESEMGHCTGHLGLNQHIWVPGMEQSKARAELDKRQSEIRRQRRQQQGREKR